MKSKFLFVGGCPRSGTSLLSSLIGNISGVGVVQDLCLMFYLKRVCLEVMYRANGLPVQDCSLYAVNTVHSIDLRKTEFFPAYLDNTFSQSLNDYHGINGSILRKHISAMDDFLFSSLNATDPRKDRGQGCDYLRKIDFNTLLDSGSMSEVLLKTLNISSTSLIDPLDSTSVDLVCDKTPENIVALDVIDQCFNVPSFYFLRIVRDPVSVFGSRRQRIQSSAEDFVTFFRIYAYMHFSMKNCISQAVIRYEDLLIDSCSAVHAAFDQLGLSLNRNFKQLTNSMNPGKYLKYVGFEVDSKRDTANRNMVSDSEKNYIYEHLSDFCQEFGYGAYFES